ncbi:hypothetical protein GE09DRAFT_245521 [Coniochaeta sp. 2T2.1]|nr:hypothetical protein GE09DRAFT_245521 [Coniochaeta sp. 2T2.1]
MVKTSREIMTAVLDVFNEDGIDFMPLKFADFAGIVRLLGCQGEYKELERILPDLWNSREVKEWDQARVLSISCLLVHVYHANGVLGPAVEIYGKLLYNLQRGKGYLHPKSIGISSLVRISVRDRVLPSFPATRRPDKAMNIYEAHPAPDRLCFAPARAHRPRCDRHSGSFRQSIGYKPIASVETDPRSGCCREPAV